MRTADAGTDMAPQGGGVQTEVVMKRPPHEHRQGGCHEQQHGWSLPDGKTAPVPVPVEDQNESAGVDDRTISRNWTRYLGSVRQ